MKFLTLARLKKMGACSDALWDFENTFGTKASLVSVVRQLHKGRGGGLYGWAYPIWEAWLLGKDLPLTQDLIKAGANISVNNGRALIWAVEANKPEIVSFLLNNGINNAQALNALKNSECKNAFWKLIHAHERVAISNRVIKILKEYIDKNL